MPQADKEYIYRLKDPREHEEIESTRYIGRTKYPQMRFAAHIKTDKDNGNPDKLAWIQELLDLGLLPVMEVMEAVPTSSEVRAAHREKYWIQYYKELGANLLNITYAEEPKPNPYPIVFNIVSQTTINPLAEENLRLRAENQSLLSEVARLRALLGQISNITEEFQED